MKLLEAVIGMFIIAIVLTLGVNYLIISENKFEFFTQNLKNNSEKTNLYNYSNHLVNHTSENQSGYIFLSGHNYNTGNKGNFPYTCKIRTGTLIKTDLNYTGVFCKIETKDENIYNHRILKNQTIQ